MKQSLFKFFLTLALITMASVTLADEVTVDEIKYEVIKKGKFVKLIDGSNCTGNVVIPEYISYEGENYKVTTISEGSFYECQTVTSVQIPNSVTAIEDYAFAYCDSLENINLSDSLINIGTGTFRLCM